MKKRNPFAVFVFGLITLGIYDLYWLVKTRAALNEKTTNKTPTVWLLFSPIVILIVGYILMVMGMSSNVYGTSHLSGTGVIGLAVVILAGIATFIISGYWFFKFSKSVAEFTHDKMSSAVTFLALWIVHLIGVFLVQDAINDVLDAPAMGTAGTPSPQVAAASGVVTPTEPVTEAPAPVSAQPVADQQNPTAPQNSSEATEGTPQESQNPRPAENKGASPDSGDQQLT